MAPKRKRYNVTFKYGYNYNCEVYFPLHVQRSKLQIICESTVDNVSEQECKNSLTSA